MNYGTSFFFENFASYPQLTLSFAYRNVSQSFVINHLIEVVDTFQCVCVLSNFQHLNLHLHVLFTLNFELGQFATLFLAPKIKLWRLTYN